LFVIILGSKKSVTAEWDCAMAAQNMMLAPHSRDIGCCRIGLALQALMDEKISQELALRPAIKPSRH
jgi:nitroreductase